MGMKKLHPPAALIALHRSPRRQAHHPTPPAGPAAVHLGGVSARRASQASPACLAALAQNGPAAPNP
jgi:hypothetical protein